MGGERIISNRELTERNQIYGVKGLCYYPVCINSDGSLGYMRSYMDFIFTDKIDKIEPHDRLILSSLIGENGVDKYSELLFRFAEYQQLHGPNSDGIIRPITTKKIINNILYVNL